MGVREPLPWRRADACWTGLFAIGEVIVIIRGQAMSIAEAIDHRSTRSEFLRAEPHYGDRLP